MPGAESCIPTQALARAVEDRLARRVFVSAAQADVSVEGRIEKSKGKASGWRAVITIRDGAGATLGTRELEKPDASCDAMNEPLALVIAVMIDPDAATRPPAGDAGPPAGAGAGAAAASGAGAAADAGLGAGAGPAGDAGAGAGPGAPGANDGDAGRRREPWRAEGAGLVTLAGGLAPSLAAGVGVEGLLFVPGLPLGFRAYGNIFLPTEAERGGARASFDMVYAGGAVCPTLRRPRIVAMLCFGGQLGILRSHSESPGRFVEEKTRPMWNAVTEARLSVPLAAPVELTASVGGVLPILRPAFGFRPAAAPATSTDTENIHKVAFFGFTASIGVGFFFP